MNISMGNLFIFCFQK